MFLPELSSSAHYFFRTLYGLLLLGVLTAHLPHAYRFFMSERWGGYAKSQKSVDLIQNPFVLPLVLGIWFLAAGYLALDLYPFQAALANLIICWYFFIFMRWRGVLRGMGAPGYVTYWLSLAVFLLEYTARFAPHLKSLALLVLQIDFAFIIFCSGYYKFRSGYPQNEGMELGLVNPEWGYFPEFYNRLKPPHWIFNFYNQCAWSLQIATAILMLIPQTRFWGGILLILSFLIIRINIRLTFLCELVMMCGFLFFVSGSPGDKLAHLLFPFEIPSVISYSPVIHIINAALPYGLVIYLICLPFVYMGLFYNFYGRKTLPSFLQKMLERYTNLFGIILWRVFSADLIDFYIQIYRGKELISDWSNWKWTRFNHVGEAITVTSVFTTLRYYPNRPELFEERLLRYAKTLPNPANELLRFEYTGILKEKERFHHVQAAEYTVDLKTQKITERTLNPGFPVRKPHARSPIHEGSTPGSYRPKS